MHRRISLFVKPWLSKIWHRVALPCDGHEQNESAIDDPAWQYAEKTTTKFFANISQLVEADAVQAAADFADGSIEVLLIDDVDSGETVRQELEIWRSKLSAKALVLLHGTSLERQDSPRTAWLNFVIGKGRSVFR